MANATATTMKTEADKRWGFQFGVDGLMTVKEVADLLRVHRATVWRYMKNGVIRSGSTSQNRGGRARLCKRSVIAYARSLET